MASHYPLSPSAMGRILACPGSVNLVATCPPEPPSAAAEEGTAAHAVLERSLVTGADTAEFTDDAEQADATRVAVDFTSSFPRAMVEGIELHIPPQPGLPETFAGTVDYFALGEDRVLRIVDYKYGQGVAVRAKENQQLLSYALLVLFCLGIDVTIERVELSIVQPRCAHGDPIDTWVTAVDRLLEFRQQLLDLEHRQDEFAAGDHCRWCPAKLFCDTFQAQALAVAQEEFRPVVDLDRAAQLFLMGPAIKATLAELEPILREHLLQGGELPRIKLVKAISRRAWQHDEATTIKLLQEAGVPKTKSTESKLKSPTQVEKTLGSDTKFNHLVNKADRGVVVAPESDRRKAVDPQAVLSEEFPRLEEES